MQSSKIDFISKYNNLINVALTASGEFPGNLCDYLVSEFDLEAVVLVKIKENGFEFLGKSSSAKKSYDINSKLLCTHCNSLNYNSTETKFESNPQCEFKASDVVLNEACLHISITDNERVLLKIAKKSEFTSNDKDNLIVIGNTIRNLLRLWMGKKGSLSNSVSEIIASISSELRAPTNSILGFASLITDEKLSQAQLEYLATLKENSHELLSLLNDVIDLAKLETDRSSSDLTQINLSQFFNEIIKVFEDQIDRNKIEIITNIDKNLPVSARVNPTKLKYIVVNLFTISLRLTERGKITLSVFSSEKNQLKIRISDTGTGVPADKLKDIFTPYSLVDQYVNTTGGTTGLGLTLVKRYIDFLNGELEISSTIGKGTTFNLNIPVEEITAIEEQISTLPKPDLTNKVLVVEDDYATSKLLGNYLNKWGYEPTIVNSAEQTLKILEKEQFLAILMDIVLPDANGLELLQRIREIKNSKKTPVVICSVEAEQQKAFLMGAVEYFVKPINYKFLVEVLTHYRLRKDSHILIVDD
ncbi:MAG: response regulator, partial [Ignavibacteriaceae bacterium]|nr:response regulator [Ignavibacteriaceae bacterium]